MSAPRDHMQRTMAALEKLFPGCAIVLLVASFDVPVGSRVNYVGNLKREDIAVMMKEILARWEGRHQEAPAGAKQ